MDQHIKTQITTEEQAELQRLADPLAKNPPVSESERSAREGFKHVNSLPKRKGKNK